MTTLIVLSIYSVVITIIFLVIEFHSIRVGNESFKIPEWLWNNIDWIRRVNW